MGEEHLSDNFVSTLRMALGVDEILEKLDALKAEIAAHEHEEGPAYFTLKRACELKGISYNSVKSNLRLQPSLGKEDCRISGRRMWRRATIEEWLNITDE